MTENESKAAQKSVPGKARENPGLVWRNRKKISQIINGYYLYLPFSLLIILCYWLTDQNCCCLHMMDLTPIAYRSCFGALTACTANEGPMRIQYKYLVPIYVFPEMKLLFPKQNYYVVSQFLHSYIYERFIYFQDRSNYSAPGKYEDRSWEYINSSQTHKCGNWD